MLVPVPVTGLAMLVPARAVVMTVRVLAVVVTVSVFPVIMAAGRGFLAWRPGVLVSGAGGHGPVPSEGVPRHPGYLTYSAYANLRTCCYKK